MVTPMPLPTYTVDMVRAEVASPSSRYYDRDNKLEAYLGLGVEEVWLVDIDAFPESADPSFFLASRYGTARPRSAPGAEFVEYRVEQHAAKLADRCCGTGGPVAQVVRAHA